jgi:hypothetical protein
MSGSRFTLRVEELGARITPSIKGGSTGDFGQVAVAADAAPVHTEGAKLGIASGSNAEVAHGVYVGGPGGGHVDPYGGRGGITGDV